ncbi:MAG: SPOR domain-containing protein [Bacteroidota bacterium]|nr:SPOR domain-containing protein [Bacteroidota bacterium]
MRYLCSVILFLGLLSASVYAQNDTLALYPGISSQTAKMEELLGKLSIRQDPRITDLLVRHSQINQRKRGTDGFRLEIFFSSGNKAREQAERVRNDFNLTFPAIPTYLIFQTPNFKLRVGDFRNKSEALKAKSTISYKYPNAFIVKDIIRFPELFPENFEQIEEPEEQ